MKNKTVYFETLNHISHFYYPKTCFESQPKDLKLFTEQFFVLLCLSPPSPTLLLVPVVVPGGVVSVTVSVVVMAAVAVCAVWVCVEEVWLSNTPALKVPSCRVQKSRLQGVTDK